MTMIADDTVVTVREEQVRGYDLVITAERERRLEAWLMICRADGELYLARATDYPEECAAGIIKEFAADVERGWW
ncbi:MAG TPA: hypothetical protein VMF32_25410 [Xanthobacteraceae bacterium]|nr:hypothetical protein [Xanthobacteraceae bacterium]